MNLSCGRKAFVNCSSGLRWWIAVVNVDRLIERYQEAKSPPNAFKWRVLEPGIFLFVFNLFPIVPLRRPAVKYQRFVLYLCLLIPRWISALRCECSDDFSRSNHARSAPSPKAMQKTSHGKRRSLNDLLAFVPSRSFDFEDTGSQGVSLTHCAAQPVDNHLRLL